MNFTQIGGRRFALTLLTLLSTTALTWFGKVSGEVYSVVIIATVGALVTGHTVENVKSIGTVGGSGVAKP